ncbi:MAG: hypothetical protein M3N08_07410 [Pseudomonadota bacterium]|nr:hypothetical protein [Pseudomonadota bacterium]
MRYLLVGNGPAPDIEAAAEQADVIVQINRCIHADRLPAERTRYIFLVNTDVNLSARVVDELYAARDSFKNVSIVRARNPTLYTFKKLLLIAQGKGRWRNFRLSPAWKRLRKLWPVQKVSLVSSFILEVEMSSRGMPLDFQPSTGLIAYRWLRARLKPGDSLDIAGFTFEGWDRHPWRIERQLVHPIYGEADLSRADEDGAGGRSAAA